MSGKRLPVGGKNPAHGGEKPPAAAVLEVVESITTFAGQWFDPVSLAIVLGGTLLATLLRCGFAGMRLALGKIGALVTRPFDPAKAKAELSRQLREIENDGLLRAQPINSGDREFDCLSDTLASRRSVETIHAQHEEHKRKRTEAAETAMHVLGQAAELAPVLGLAGTLIGLGMMPSDLGSRAGSGGMTGAIAMAVITTLYGLAAANFLFSPLAAAIARRSAREERDRQAVLDWLESGVRKAAPKARPARGEGAEITELHKASMRKAS